MAEHESGTTSGQRKTGVHDEALSRGRTHRMALAALTAVLSAYWVGWPTALGWIALVGLQEFFFLPFVMSRLVTPNLKIAPKKSVFWGAFITLVGASVYAAGWAPAYFTGAEGSGFFAGVWLACSVIHALVYSHKDRVLFITHVIPPLAVALIGPFAIYGATLLSVVMILATGRLALTTFIALRDRLALLANVKLSRSQRKAAEEASAAKSRFLATMSHELRTPLNAVIGYAEMLEDDMNADARPTAAADAARIHRAARQLLTLIDEVLDLSKVEAGRMELSVSAVDVPAMLAGVVETTHHIAKANGNAVRVSVGPAVGLRQLDGQRTRQCIENLVSNACKFTSNGAVEIAADIVEVGGAERLRIAVADTGPGIAQEHFERVFQPFAQIDNSDTRAKDGAGLGLAVTRRLAQLMGGDVTLESAPGAGSTFTLTVALASATPANQSEAPALALAS